MADQTPLTPRTPFGRLDPLDETIGAFTIAESTATAIASLAVRRGRTADVERAAAEAGIALAGPGRLARGDPWMTVWTGPEQWLVLAPFEGYEDIVAALEPLFGDAVSLAEQTDAFVRLDLVGAPPAGLMERLCPLDLHAMKPGDAARTLVEHMGCHVLCLEPDRLALLAPRSFAASLRHALVAAAESVAAIAAMR